MKKISLFTLHKTYRLIVSVLIVLCLFGIVRIDYSYAGTDAPFRMLKVGTKNITKFANNCCSIYTGVFDGGIEIPLGNIKGVFKRGSKVQIKLKKGFKYEMYYICDDINKRIRNNFKIPTSEKNWYIDLRIKKGAGTGYFWLVPYYDSDMRFEE